VLLPPPPPTGGAVVAAVAAVVVAAVGVPSTKDCKLLAESTFVTTAERLKTLVAVVQLMGCLLCRVAVSSALLPVMI